MAEVKGGFFYCQHENGNWYIDADTQFFYLKDAEGFWYSETDPPRSEFKHYNFRAAQHRDIFGAMHELIEKIRPARVLEIGTDAGGLTVIMRHLLDQAGLPDSPVKTYDIRPCKPLSDLAKNDGIKIDVIMKDAYPGSQLIQEIIDYIQAPGVSLVLCDGGNKPLEFRLCAPFLKSGDVIMAHDYAPSHDYFNQHINNQVWNWLETTDNDINGPCTEFNLQPFMARDFFKVVWACRRKE